MTSRSSFFNLLKEDFRRRLWTFILASLVFFATFVIAFTMMLQNWVSNYNTWDFTEAEYLDRMSANICDFLGSIPWFVIVAVVGAIICGMNGFAYLHSRKQMDFYHSLPVKRETLFAVRFVNGIMIYAIPYLIGLLYTYLISAVYGVMTTDILYCGMFCFVIHLMGYSVMYLVTIIAMMLTGKMVIAFFGITVLNLYAPAIYGLALALRDTFFVTTYSSSVDIGNALQVTRWLSPASYYFSMISVVTVDEAGFWLEFLSFLLMAAVLIAVALWLYKKRPSEKADTAMSFKISEPVIRVMISIPVGVLAGLLLFAIQYDYGMTSAAFWLVFGSLLGAFLAHGIIESLYQGDVKKCLSHKGQMAGTMVVSAIIPICFFFDVFGYDSYLPEKNEIANMAVVSSELRFAGNYYDEEGWITPVEYALEEMEVTEIDAMYELAALLSSNANESRKEAFFGYSYCYQYAEDGEKVYVTDFIVKYTLKNGKEVIRRYEYNYYAVLELLERIYNDEEFKMAVHPLFSLEKAGWTPTKVECYAPVSPISGVITNGMEHLLDVYRSEFLGLTFDDLKNTAAIGELIVWFEVGEDIVYEDSSTFLVYPSMTQTIALIKEHGYSMQSIEDVNTVNFISINYYGSINELKNALGMEGEEEEAMDVYDGEFALAWEYDEYGNAKPLKETEIYQEIYVEFTDPAEIAEIVKGLVPYNYTSEFGPFPVCFGGFTANVSFQVGNTAADSDVVAWTDTYRFLEDGVPPFVIDRLFEELGEQ